MSRYLGYYDCCEHCDPANGGMHPMDRDRHVGPCPKGCNDADAAFREPGQ